MVEHDDTVADRRHRASLRLIADIADIGTHGS